MNRDPSTTIKPPRNATLAIQPRVDRAVWLQLFADARAAHTDKVTGLVCATPERAFFQVVGDPTVYSIALLPAERALFIY